MFTIFVVKQGTHTVVITTPERFSAVLQRMKLTTDMVRWQNVSMESLTLLLDNVNEFIAL